METQHGACLGVSLFVSDRLLVEGLAKERERGAIHPGAGLDDMRDEAFLRGFVEIIERLAGVLDVLPEVVVGAVGDAFQLAHAEGEFVFEVVGFLRVEGALAVRDVFDVDLRARDADVLIKFQALLEPVVGELHSVLGAAEILDLHLLEFPRTENVVAWIDLIAKRLADLRDAEGELLARGIEDIAEIHKDRLRGLGAEVDEVVVALERTRVGFEHQIEIARLGEIAAATVRAIFFAILLRQLIGAVARVALFAVHHRIAESLLVARGLPHGAVHDDRAVHALHVIALPHIAAPPEVLQVFLQLHPERTVIPESIDAAVDFGRLKNEPAPLAEADDFFHSGGCGVLRHKGGMKADLGWGVNPRANLATK